MISEALAASGSGTGGGGSLATWLPMWIAILAIMYFLIIRPQKKKQRDTDTMLKSIKKGDRVLTIGGIYGIISNIREKDNILILKIADNVRIEVSRNSIAQVIHKDKN